MIFNIWRIIIGTVYAVFIYALVMGAVAVFTYFADYQPELVGNYYSDESMIRHYLGESWIYLARGKHWLGEREIWVETICLLVGIVGALLGRWPLTRRKD